METFAWEAPLGDVRFLSLGNYQFLPLKVVRLGNLAVWILSLGGRSFLSLGKIVFLRFIMA